MTKAKAIPQKAQTTPLSSNGSTQEALTLTDAAIYLRIPEAEVLRMVGEQVLPGRQVGAAWRFLKIAVQRCLSQPLSTSKGQGIWGAAGSWKDDPFLDDSKRSTANVAGR